MSNEKLDSELLRTFLAITNTGSFTKGADQVFRSQSAVSLQIKQLEMQLGQKVFKRHARGVSLTSAGEALRPAAQRVINILDQTIGELKRNPLEGSIRIGIPDEYGKIILPQIIANFSRQHPQVELEVRCGFSAGFEQALAHNKLDLAIYEVESPSKNVTTLRQEKTVWACSEHYQPDDHEILSVALFDQACWWRDRTIEALNESGRRYRVIYTSESVAGVVAAIEAGVAIGPISRHLVKKNIRILPNTSALPNLPASYLILDCRNKIDLPAMKVLTQTICERLKSKN